MNKTSTDVHHVKQMNDSNDVAPKDNKKVQGRLKMYFGGLMNVENLGSMTITDL